MGHFLDIWYWCLKEHFDILFVLFAPSRSILDYPICQGWRQSTEKYNTCWGLASRHGVWMDVGQELLCRLLWWRCSHITHVRLWNKWHSDINLHECELNIDMRAGQPAPSSVHTDRMFPHVQSELFYRSTKKLSPPRSIKDTGSRWNMTYEAGVPLKSEAASTETNSPPVHAFTLHSYIIPGWFHTFILGQSKKTWQCSML